MLVTFKVTVDEDTLAAQVLADSGSEGVLSLIKALDVEVADCDFTLKVLELAIGELLSDLEKSPASVPEGGAQRLAAMLQTAREKVLGYC